MHRSTAGILLIVAMLFMPIQIDSGPALSFSLSEEERILLRIENQIEIPFSSYTEEDWDFFETHMTRGAILSHVHSLMGVEYGDIIWQAATENRINPLILVAVLTQESRGVKKAVSNKGARGLMQVMPATASMCGVTNVYDPSQNIGCGAWYLTRLRDHHSLEDLSLMLAAYNAGPTAVSRYGGIPPYRETRNYVRKIKNHLNHLHVEKWRWYLTAREKTT